MLGPTASPTSVWKPQDERPTGTQRHNDLVAHLHASRAQTEELCFHLGKVPLPALGIILMNLNVNAASLELRSITRYSSSAQVCVQPLT
jgi:hypothetical protein